METIFNTLIDLSYDGLRLTLNGLWLGAVFAGISWLVWRSAKKTDAATGYVAWWVVLALVIAAPFFAGHSFIDHTHSLTGSETSLLTSSDSQPVDISALPIILANDNNRTAFADPKPASTVKPLISGAVSQTSPPPRSVAKQADGRSVFSLVLGLLPMSLFGIWLCVLVVLMLRLFFAYRRISIIKRNSVAFDTSRLSRVDSLLERKGTRRLVRVRVSSEINMPMAAGLGNPVVLIPAELPQQLTETELEAVILHELAHFRRWDDWTKLGQRVVQAGMFFNPVIHWIGRQLDLAREIACDDHVVAQTGKPAEYARCLGRLTQLTVKQDALLIPGALTSRKQIFKRFDSLLDKKKNRVRRLSRPRMFVAVVSLAIALIVTIQFAPVIAVPLEAVTFSDLTQTAQILAADILPGPAPIEEPQAEIETEPVDPEPELSETIAEVDDLPTAPLEPSTGNVLPIEANAVEEAASVLAAVDPVADEDDTFGEDKAPDRVVHWDDKIFQMSITGNIHSSNWRYGDRDTPLVVWLSDNKKFRSAMQGDVKFSRDNRAVMSISPDGFLALKEEHGSTRRELDIEPGAGEELRYTYYVNGVRGEFDDNTREWLAEILQDMVPEVAEYGATDDAAIFFDEYGGTDDAADFFDEFADQPRPERRHSSRSLLGRLVDWTADIFDGFQKGTMISSDDDGTTSIMWSDGRNKLSAKLSGEIEFTDDDRGIAYISDRGYFSIMEKRGSRRRELDVEPGSDGRLNYGYYVNGRSHDFDDDAQKWLGNVLIDIIRKTGVGATERVARILKHDGVKGVLDEIDLIEGDYVQRLYFTELLNSGKLTENDCAKVVRQIASQIDSDYEKAELLISIADDIQGNSPLLRLFVQAVETIDSDYETRRVLSTVSLDRDTDDEVIFTVLEIAADIGSDFEKAELLIDIAPLCRSHPKMQQAYTEAVFNVDSDYEKRRILTALAEDSELTPQTLADHIMLAEGISSDYEKAEILLELSKQCEGKPELQTAIVRASASLDSDYETRRVLSALHYDCRTNPEITEDILTTLEPRSSSYEKAELLVDLTKCVNEQPKLAQPYLRAAQRIDSDYETRRVLTALIDRVNFAEHGNDLILAILPVVADISSDYDKSQVLQKLVEYCRGDDDLEEAFLDVVDTIDSDYESNNLYAKLYREKRRSREWSD